ncbi:zinc-dependent peptidase [Psychrobacter sp. FDAARGOS_221]|uniref:M90 family metallopeptidase n=1 Tax=Psychrobacter sp. FDAARGOS_221 TaxID=1975705 RepID=UPI000BB5386C|nr:M90 family metallopeptidase [Psychrobacter sp. FDAARGOS_221]PNK59610.1 Mlc titration factor A [Psychrobacter sp. FDAARGOS_221]
MFGIIKDWREQWIVDHSPYTDEQWRRIAAKIDILDRLNDQELTRLIHLAILFLHDKSINGVQGFEVTDAMKQSIALQACLPILNLGLDWYKGWSSVLIYPSSYISETTATDEVGVVHTGYQHRSGEAWLHGPVILSWDDVKDAGRRDGHNVVIHEFVHKLDMLNGRANGFPPIQSAVDRERWTKIMEQGFAEFQYSAKAGIDDYGATSPAEFFAVLSEVFFERPQDLIDAYPDIYQLMVEFFQQQPLS